LLKKVTFKNCKQPNQSMSRATRLRRALTVTPKQVTPTIYQQ